MHRHKNEQSGLRTSQAKTPCEESKNILHGCGLKLNLYWFVQFWSPSVLMQFGLLYTLYMHHGAQGGPNFFYI